MTIDETPDELDPTPDEPEPTEEPATLSTQHSELSTVVNWRSITGFESREEKNLSSAERRPYFKRLYNMVWYRMRVAFEEVHSGAHPDATPYWTAVPGVCADLMITPAQLNRYLKEYCGLTATQLYDQIKAHKTDLAEKIAGDVAEFIRARFVPGGATRDGYDMDVDDQQLKFWRAWKENLKDCLGWDKTAWALEYGFPSYARFCRAVVLQTGMTPIQIEAKEMREAAIYFRAANSLYIRSYCEEDHQPYRYKIDHYVQLRSENPEWWTKMRARYGMTEKLHELEKRANQTEAKFNPDCCEFERPLCTPETKIQAQFKTPPTHYLNPWPEPKEPTQSPITPAVPPE